MFAVSSRSVLTTIALLVVLGGCGRPYARPAGSTAHWHAEPSTEDRYWGLSRREPGAFPLPEARHGREDRRGTIYRLVVNVMRDGDLIFQGKRWRFATASVEERAETLRDLEDGFRRRLFDASLREKDGTSRVPLLLCAEREAPWGSLRELARIAVHDSRFRIRILHWPVHTWARRVGWRHEARATPVDPDDHPRSGLAIRIDGRGEANGPGEIILGIGTRSWSFGTTAAPFEDAAYLKRANRIWDEVAGHLDEVAADPASARVEVDESVGRVTWAHIVKVFDLLMGAGIFEVWMPDLGVRLELAPGQPLESAYARDDPLLTPGVAALCVLAVALAFALTFWPLRRRKAARRKARQ